MYYVIITYQVPGNSFRASHTSDLPGLIFMVYSNRSGIYIRTSLNFTLCKMNRCTVDLVRRVASVCHSSYLVLILTGWDLYLQDRIVL